MLHCTFTVYFLSCTYESRDSDTLAWVQGQRKMSQVLGTFGLLDFTMIQPVLAWRMFWNLWTALSLIFPFFGGGTETEKLEQGMRGHNCTQSVVVIITAAAVVVGGNWMCGLGGTENSSLWDKDHQAVPYFTDYKTLRTIRRTLIFKQFFEKITFLPCLL
jgi:hypothetical protein